MTEQLQLRRGTATQVAAFTGAQGEVVVDTTNNRLVVQDGATAGGFAAAKLSDVATTTRTAVSDAAYAVLATDELIAYVALTAARTVTLCAASAYPAGARLTIVDETGACSLAASITVSRAGSDTIDGSSSFVINAAYGGLEIESNGSNGWTILSPRPNLVATLVGIGTPPNPSNPLSVYGAAALFNGPASINLTINKGGSAGASSGTASLIFEDGFSGRAQMGLNGSDNFSFKVSPNGSTWMTAIALDATTGAATFANQRTAISDAAYSALTTDRLIAYTAITAARVVTLPAANVFAAGQALLIVDESGACSATDTITVSRAGSDTINGGTSVAVASGYGYVALESNGSSAWTIVDQSAQGSSIAAITSGTINGATIGATSPSTGAFTTIALARHAVSDAAYSVAASVSTVAYTAITAARIVTLPAASSYAAGQSLTVVDESGACSATNTITLARAGSDTINGAASAVIAIGYGYLEVESNGSNAWTIIDTAALFAGDSGSGGAQGLVPAPPSHAAASNEVLGASGAWVGQMAGFRNRIINGAMDIWQRGTSFSNPTSATTYCADRWSYYRGGYAINATASQTTGLSVNGNNRNALRIQRTSGDTSTAGFSLAQSLESLNSRDLAGQTVTFSFYARVGANFSGTSLNVAILSGTGTDEAVRNGLTGSVTVASTTAPPSQTGYARFSCTGTLVSTVNELSVLFSYTPAGTAGANDWFEVLDAQLEAGQVATPFERRPIGSELALCQRYLPALTDNGAGSNAFGIATNASATLMLTIHSFSVPARVPPTGVTTTAVTGFIAGAPISLTPSVVSLNASSSAYIGSLSWTVAGATAGQCASFRAQTANAQILFTGCEL